MKTAVITSHFTYGFFFSSPLTYYFLYAFFLLLMGTINIYCIQWSIYIASQFFLLSSYLQDPLLPHYQS